VFSTRPEPDPVGAGQESAWEYPRPPRLERTSARLVVVLDALKKYGMIVADNGSNWFISGAADTRWDDDDLNQLKTVPGSAFEVVDTGETLHR
jgi:hypothetical protein